MILKNVIIEPRLQLCTQLQPVSLALLSFFRPDLNCLHVECLPIAPNPFTRNLASQLIGSKMS